MTRLLTNLLNLLIYILDKLTGYLSWKMLFSWIIVGFPLVELITSNRFVGAVSTSAADGWEMGMSHKLCEVKEKRGRSSSSSGSRGGSAGL